MHNGSALETLPGPTPIVAALHENHLYLSKSTKTRKKLVTWKTEEEREYRRVRQGTRLKREHVANAATPPAQEWKAFAQTIEAGHFYVSEEEIGGVRAWFLESRRCPRVSLKDLFYTLTHV